MEVLFKTIEDQVSRVGFDWPSNVSRRDVAPERILYRSRQDIADAVWHRAVLMAEVKRLREIEFVYLGLCK